MAQSTLVNATHASEPSQASGWWWLEFEVGLLIVLILGVYFTRLTALTIRGEESRRAQVAVEMMTAGDWIVPRQQGEPFLSRPPLGSWVIALAIWARGECDLVAVRLPTVLATLLTTLMIYGYSRRFLSRLGALAAAAAYATMGQVLILGQLAETEATFTLLLSASLLLWHWGYAAGWAPVRTWIAGYVPTALAALAKGPQAPVYFGASVGFFLLLTRQWRFLLTRAHAVGLATFAIILAAWHIPFYQELGWDGIVKVWAADSSPRLAEVSLSTVGPHLLSYPLEVLGCTLPWSVLLALYFCRPLRRSLGQARSAVIFLTICLAATFPSCWIVPAARGRYFMPLYPCMAPLIGLVIQRCLSLDAPTLLRQWWRRYVTLCAALMFGAALTIAGCSWFVRPPHVLLAQPRLFALTYAGAAIGLGGLALWSRNGAGRWRPQAGFLSVACFVGLTYSGVFINGFAMKSTDPRPAMAELEAKLPQGEPLFSLGPIHHAFAYYHRAPIALLPWPGTDDKVYQDVNYFCFERMAGDPPMQMPFAWKEIAAIPFDRFRSTQPEDVVVVGKRLNAEDANAANIKPAEGKGPANHKISEKHG